MIGRIHERTIFRRLRREGSVVRGGPLWCSVLLDPSLTQAHVAYALGRPVGAATVRNQLRRRMREIVRAEADNLSPGWYLIGADSPAVALSFQELSARLPELLGRAAAKNRSREAGTGGQP